MNDEINDILAQIVSYKAFPAIQEDVNEVMSDLLLFKQSPLEEIEIQKSLEKLNQILIKDISTDFNKIIERTKNIFTSKVRGEQEPEPAKENERHLLSFKVSGSLTFFPFPTERSWEEVQKHLGFQL